MNLRATIPSARKKLCKSISSYTDSCGSQVRSGRRQSLPSSSIANCARVSATVPLVRLRPHETSAFQPLGEQTQSVPVVPQKLNQITSSSAKHEHVTGEGALLQLGLHQSAQPGEAAS